MGDALRAQPRDVVYSLCEYGLAAVETWGASVGAQLWRTGHDLNDTWGSMSAAGFFNAERDHVTAPGSWNDLDFLMLGRIGWGGKLHPVRFTPDEQRTHFSLWCVRGSPLLLAGDPRELDGGTLALLTNDEAIAVNQDLLARPARRVVLSETTEAWIRDLDGGDVAVALFNRDEEAAVVRVEWPAVLGIPGAWSARDIWGDFATPTPPSSTWSAEIPRHGVTFLRLTEPGGFHRRQRR
jgi:alpha-galactosidase